MTQLATQRNPAHSSGTGTEWDRDRYVLIVDDDAGCGVLHARTLTDAGIPALVIPDGPTALEYVRLHDVQLVLLDQRMPGMNGMEVLERLRSDARTQRIPVIILTGENETSALVQGLDAGADESLAKPVKPAELVAHVRAIVRGRIGPEEFRRGVDTANLAYVSWNEDGLVKAWNGRATTIFGWEPHEVLGQPFASTIIAPTQRVLHDERMRRFRSFGSSPLAGEHIEVTALTRDGVEIPVEMSMWVVTSERKHTFNAHFRDLSRRREMESALDHNERLRELIDGGPDMVTLTDATGLFYVSPACRTILGYEPDELIEVFTLIHPNDLDAAVRAHDEALHTFGRFSCSCRVRAKSGNYVWMESRGAAIRRDEDPAATAIHAVWRDVSIRVQITEERARSAIMLETANATLNESVCRERQAVEDLRRLDRAKTDFVSTVSHELRTPLTSIVGYAEILTDQCAASLDAEQVLAVQVIDRNARRLLNMIEDLLLISRVETGELELVRYAAQIGPIIESAARAVLPTAQAQHIEVRTSFLPTLPDVLADPEHIDRVLLNLLSNAIKFSLPGGHVSVSAIIGPAGAEITVSDDGIGIAPEDRPRLFDRFYRGSTATEQAIQGSGLGLFIVRHIVDLHGGKVFVRPGSERGTDVTFTLPLAPALSPCR